MLYTSEPEWGSSAKIGICLRVESDQGPHKPGCTTTKDSQRLEILNLGSRGIVLYLYNKNKGTDQRNHAADPRLCFRIFKYQDFS